MSESLVSRRRASLSGKTGSVVVLLHGYGADGTDLLGLAEPLAPHMPDTVFVAPDAPERCVNNPFGYQWFPIPWLDGSSEEAANASRTASAAQVDAFLDRLLEEEGITPSQLVLFGFSQGTMMSLHVAPRRREPIAGIVGFSGRLLDPGKLAAEARSKPPVLLVHGDADDIVPISSLAEAGDALTRAGFETYAHVMKGTAHGIAADGLSVALAFMREKLGIAR
ncbi:MAG: prolyl oligopeptidase family serine peptidase [Rhodobacteraceae bacterium]|nr:prolyl oligopeptidase family serine peptidase [Paracoccaceae bacterium]